MTYCIEVEERVSVHHRFFVEVECDSDIDEALLYAEGATEIDDYIARFSKYATILSTNVNCSNTTEFIEYYDCREIKETEENT